MLPKLLKYLLALAVLAPALPLIAQQAASLPTDPSEMIAWFKEMHSAGNWAFVVGGTLTVLLRFAPYAKPLLDKLPAESTKWVAAGLAMLGSVSTGLMAGVPWYTVLLDGVKVSVAAVGGWELILKPLLTKLGMQKSAA